MTNPDSPQPQAYSVHVDRRTWFALAVLLAGAFMALLDTTIVNVALSPIRSSLGASESTLSWIISGYALAFGLALIPAGRVGDRFGHRWVFIIGISLFTLASLACVLAQGSTDLVLARVVQGLGGGMFFATITALIQLMIPGPARGKAFAALGATIGVSTALGPLVGGLLIQALGDDNGWRLIFAVNLPIGVATVIAALVVLPTNHESGRLGADWIGLLLISGGLVALLVPLIEGQEQGWPLWTYLTLALGVLLILAFAWWERLTDRRGRTPLVPPRLFAHPSFTGGTILALVYFAAFTSIFFTLSLLWQSGLDNTPLATGLMLLPFAIGNTIGATRSDQFAARFGRTVLVIGLILLTVGLIALWLILLLIDPTKLNVWLLLGPLLAAGIGSGLFIAPNTDFIVATVERADAGAASGVIGTMQRIGSAIGIAVVGSVLFGTLDFGQAGPDAAAHAFGHSATIAMAVSAAFSIVALALVFALPKRTAADDWTS